jgi:hypothetical protein
MFEEGLSCTTKGDWRKVIILYKLQNDRSKAETHQCVKIVHNLEVA